MGLNQVGTIRMHLPKQRGNMTGERACAPADLRKSIGPMCTKQLVKAAMIVVLVWLPFYGSGYVHGATVPQNTTDMLSLLEFRQAITSDPREFFSSWNSSVDYCKWNGITCSRTHQGRVRELNITGQSLGGQIPPSLGNLTFLRVLDLSSNILFGQLPVLNSLSRLHILDLSHNQLQMLAPDALTNCSSLLKLDLSANMLAGSIPPEISFLFNLEVLNLMSNNFTGVIPLSLHNMTQLVILDLSENLLEGIIPEEVGQLSKMVNLRLGGNRLSGSIPTKIFNHSSLVLLDVNSNFLIMALPHNIGYTLPSLWEICLYNNMFYGQIPASLGNASSLTIIDFTYNNFNGQVPSSLGKLSFLKSLKLEQNKLEANDSKSWEFLDALGNCSGLQWLSLYDNQLQGSIPNSIGKLSKGLQYLRLDKNYLSGFVPKNMGNLTGLLALLLGYNNLSGPIGSWIGKLKNIEGLNLSRNNFNSSIPPSIGNFTLLTHLYLDSNKFDGPIPTSLGNLQYLSLLNLSCNNLQGHIPRELFSTRSTMTRLFLSSNNLQGTIPPEFSNLQVLTELHLSSNKLAGEIPDSLGQCQELEVIKIDENLLAGNIPISLGHLKSLIKLNLSHNNLSGVIPSTLAGIQLLTELDLSYNNLKGEIPRNGVFQNATAISLNGNWGLCGGSLNLTMPPCPTVFLRKKIRYYLIRVLIPIVGFLSIILLFKFALIEKMSNRKDALLLLSFGKNFPKLSYKDLAQATGNFCPSNLIGRGSNGSVYKGKLIQAKMPVAVKVFDLEVSSAERSFVSECEALRSIRHRNLLPILTACSTIDNKGNDFKALIYEFMHNGNLDMWLHDRRADLAPRHLSLVQRINIAISVADVLAYLHHDCGRAIVHCDLKPTNILLDAEMNAYLGDFGIASLISDSRSTTVGHSDYYSTVAVTGTIGYIPPEYAQSVHASTCGDVYSFGIVLLELLLDKRPTDSMFDGELSIVSFVERNFRDQILQIIDANLQEECMGFMPATLGTQNEVHRCLVSLVQVALSCTRLFPRERMNMREVAANLHSIRRSYVTAIKGDQAMLH